MAGCVDSVSKPNFCLTFLACVDCIVPWRVANPFSNFSLDG
jgi:hypothetical protein